MRMLKECRGWSATIHLGLDFGLQEIFRHEMVREIITAQSPRPSTPLTSFSGTTAGITTYPPPTWISYHVRGLQMKYEEQVKGTLLPQKDPQNRNVTDTANWKRGGGRGSAAGRMASMCMSESLGGEAAQGQQ